MSGGHSLSKGLEAGRRDLWQECRERARGVGLEVSGVKGWPAALSPGSLRPRVPAPKPSQSRKVERYNELSLSRL